MARTLPRSWAAFCSGSVVISRYSRSAQQGPDLQRTWRTQDALQHYEARPDLNMQSRALTGGARLCLFEAT